MDRATDSLWLADGGMPNFDSIGADLECDVLVVGAGIAGLSVAYSLCKEGKSVIVVDDGSLGGGETERTTAHVTAVLDKRYAELEKWHGDENTRLVAAALRESIDRISQIVIEERIECNFERKDAYLFMGTNGERDVLDLEMEAMQRVGFSDVEFLAQVPLPTAKPGPCLKIPNQAQFHVLRYLRGVVKAIQNMSGKIFCDTHVSSVKDGNIAEALTDSGHSIKARHIVIATNSPVSNLVAIHTKQAAYRSYVIGAQLDDALQIDGMFWDTANPYHYLRTAEIYGKNYLIVGGEDRKTGQDEDYSRHFRALEEWTEALIPEIGPVEFRWSGQVYEPVDGLGYIGHDPGHRENVYVATGFSGVGMTQGTLAGTLIADLIMNRKNIYSDVFKPSRKTVGTVETYLKENVNTAAQYADHLRPAELQEADIAPGEGAVVQRGTEKLAVYRDDYGQLHRMSAVCPHMAALVRWNPIEGSWDCPAHGSRFDALGGVLDGPANCDLKACPLTLDDEQTDAPRELVIGPDDAVQTV
jgi:glycine/D-amino acid oxidase-like deaminating enzyme/nitrite reductase/ring-hydroxylating ferredoxin subunit